MHLSGKTVVVTGAGGGIGRALVVALRKRGARVVGIDVNESLLSGTETAGNALPGSFTGIVLNLTDRERVMALPSQIAASTGSVDVLINNAGIIHQFISVADLSFDEIARVIDVNFWGTLNMTKAFLPTLVSRPEAHIVNLSSMAGFCPVPSQTIYGASKAAVHLLMEGMASELSTTNVRTTVVFPGAVRTQIVVNAPDITEEVKEKNRNIEWGRFVGVTAEFAAEKIIRAVERRKRRITVGSDAWMFDMLSRFAPTLAARGMAWVMNKYNGR